MKKERALEILRKRYAPDGVDDTLRIALETLIPELAESEDERIINAILSFLRMTALYSSNGCKKPEMIAWLEKQKEQPTNEEMLRTLRTEYEKGVADTIAKYEQKEQNSKDKKCTDFTVYHPLKNGKGKYECIPYSFNGSLTSFSEDKDLIDFLRTCFYTKEECNEWIKKQEEQKPVECSERHIADVFEKVGLSKIVREQGNDDLTNALQDAMLELSKVENVEWSEEGRRTIDRACVALRAYANGELPDILPSEILGYADKLQSLRPSWKPSEDEERLIKTSISFLKDFADKGYENAVECIDWLKSKLNGNTCK